MEVQASGMRMRVPPRKARLVAKEVKGKHAVLAIAQLRYHPSNGATLLRKVLESALANAVENNKLDAESMVISHIKVDEGYRMKRLRARAQGRGNRILKRTSHITVVLETAEAFSLNKSNAKPKPRPKFDGPAKKKSTKKDADAAPVAEAGAEVQEVVEETPAVEAAPVEETAVAEEAPVAEVAESEEKKEEQE